MWKNWRFYCVDILFRVHILKSVEMVGCSHFLLRWVLIMPASDQAETWLHCQLFESTSCHLGGPCRTDRWPKLQSLVLQMKPNIVWCLCYIYIVGSLVHKGFWLKWPICMRASYLDWKCCVRKCFAERSSQRCRFCALVVFCRSILGLVETALDGDDQWTMDDQWCWLRQITTCATSCKYCWVNHWDQISLQRALSRNVIEVCGNFLCFLGVGGMH